MRIAIEDDNGNTVEWSLSVEDAKRLMAKIELAIVVTEKGGQFSDYLREGNRLLRVSTD